MTQPQAKIHHHIAVSGKAATRPNQKKWEIVGLKESQFTPELEADLEKAIGFVDEQLAFWAITQFHDMEPDMVAGNRILFKAMRYWPQER
jgi:hypothetical protein